MADEDVLRTRMEERVRELEGDYERGRQTLAALESQVGETREVLLRLEGAITVLREQLDATPAVVGASRPASAVPNGRPAAPSGA